MSTPATEGSGSAYEISAPEKILAVAGLVCAAVFGLVCVDLLTGGRLSAPARAAQMIGELTDDGADD